MKDYSICEVYTLPSNGAIYGVEFNPMLKLRSMTTEEEMKRLSPSEFAYKNMSEIIDDCIMDKIPVSSYDMHIGDYQFLLHKLRVVTYGQTYPTSNVCPYCHAIHEDLLNLDELDIIEFNEETFKKYCELDLPKSGKHVSINYTTPRMLDLISQEVKEFRQKTKNQAGDPTLIITLKYLINEVDGKQPNPINVEQWLRDLPMLDTQYILSYSTKLNECLGVDVRLKNVCNVCGQEFDSVLKGNVEFFRPEINI